MRTLLVRMDLSNYCNIRCVMCTLGYKPVRAENRRIMSLENCEKIAADLFPKTRSLVLSCGYEPLVVPHFVEALVIAKRYKVPFVSFSTNAMRLDERICRATIEQGIEEIIVSVDSPDPEVFESIRVGAKFSVVMDHLKLLADLKANACSIKPELRINYTVMDANVSRIPAFIELAAPLGMSVLELRPVELRNPITAEKAGHLVTDHCAIEYDAIMPKVRELCRQKNIRLIALPSFAAKHAQDGAVKSNACILTWICAYISATGDFSPCPSGPVTGNLLEQEFAQIIRNEKMISFQKSIRHGNEFCDKCVLKDEMVG